MGAINQIEMGINAQPEKIIGLEKEHKFINWLQERISSPVKQQQKELLEQKKELQDKTKILAGKLMNKGYKKKLATIDKRVYETEKVEKYISSERFRKELEHWEPWRLNQKSIDTGKNLYIKAAKGYASERFLNWTKKEAEKAHITQDRFLAGIIESVRHIEWEAIKIMASKNIATEYTLPHLVIGSSPVVDLALFIDSLKEARKKASKKKTAGLFSREESKKQLGLAAITLFPYELAQIFAERFGRGVLVKGMHAEETISIYDEKLKRLFDSEINFWERREMTGVIVEEELHHQKYKTSEVMKEKNEWAKRNDGQADAIKIMIAGQEIEEAEGVKQMVVEITQEMPSFEKLLEPFYERIGQKQKVAK